MFYTLRKLIISSSTGVALCCLFYLTWFTYERREIFMPLVSWLRVARPQELPAATPVVVSLQGKVTKVPDGGSLVFRGPSATLYSYSLAGLVAPNLNDKTDPAERRRGENSRLFLSNLVSNEAIKMDVTFLASKHAGLGILYLGGTNVNLAMVQAGMARVNPGFIKNFSFKDQSDLMTAEAAAKAQKMGIWAE
jgi:endonuclease YncB( thermonuclease family)